MSFNLPNPSLVGILLVISTHSGPQLIYKYPFNWTDTSSSTKRGTDNKVFSTSDKDKDENQHEDDEDDELYEYKSKVGDLLEDEDDQNILNEQNANHRGAYGLNLKAWDFDHSHFYLGTKLELKSFLDEQNIARTKLLSKRKALPAKKESALRNFGHGDPRLGAAEDGVEKRTKVSAGEIKAADRRSNISDQLFGIDPAYLCEMLSPPREMCNTRFELAVEDKVFLGLPVHKNSNGTWRSASSKKSGGHGKKRKKDKEKEKEKDKDKDKDRDKDKDKDKDRDKDRDRDRDRDKDKDNDDGNENENDNEEQRSKNAQGNGKSSSSTINLNMFHVAFVMNPPPVESNYRIDEMFQHVISKLSLALKHAQQKHDFMGEQVKQILKMRDENVDEFTMLQRSSLCKMIFNCYEAIGSSKIANLLIDTKTMSFQIPIKSEFPSLPKPSVPFIPGAYLSSTVNLLSSNGLINVGQSTRYGQSHDTLTQVDGDEEDLIVHFALLLLDDPENIIRDMKTANDSMLAEFIKSIKPTESLIKLTVRIPSFDIRHVRELAFQLIYWRRARVIPPLSARSVYVLSPMAPLTTKLFNDTLAFKEKFSMLPSLPHFLKLLSPHFRKPQQFASIIPSRDHRHSYLQALGWLHRFGYVTQQLTFIWLKISKAIRIKVEEDIENENISKRGKKGKSIESKGESTDNTSKVVEKKFVPSSDNVISRPEADSYSKSSGNELAEHLKKASTVTMVEDDDVVILDPGRASTLERRWINEVIFECKLSMELTAVFYKLLKYMNGENPLELLLMRENVTRADLKKILYAIEYHITSVRHW
ncbi:uncharacterized protein LODBEIA_P18220 [Lodderomyces beijingensis]|uniref:Nitrogen permease regulator 3 n=1 Tax=Lodderomyces beijingensis TaxID=1775926 RepID=A0ABP0ZHG2_9ASCO